MNLSHVDVTNESDRHGGGQPLSVESHFRLVLVGEVFAGLTRLERHRRINELLAAELTEHVHALGLQAFTPAEWAAKGGRTFGSPACRG